MFFWRGRVFSGLVCPTCKSLWDNPDDSFEEHVGAERATGPCRKEGAMTLRLGFVGVGRWARKLAESFRACGAEVVAYDRKNKHSGEMVKGHCLTGANGDYPFGRFCIPWQDMIADKNIDAIVAVAPPEATTEVALACAEAGKPVMATKPLFDHPATIRAPFYVDLWRLYSRGWRLFTGPPYPAHCSTNYELHGSGPFRDFPGGLDYGPHVMAWVFSQYGLGLEQGGAQRGPMLKYAHRIASEQGELFSVGGAGWEARFGNGSPGKGAAIDHSGRSARRVGFSGKTEMPDFFMSWTETPTTITFEGPVGYAANGNDYGAKVIVVERKEDVLREFCQSFLDDVSSGFADTKLLCYSREGMKLLEQIREMAK